MVDRAAWQAELDALQVRERAHAREGDAIAAARRREARKNRPAIYRVLPDVVWWDGEYWRTGNLKAPYPDY